MSGPVAVRLELPAHVETGEPLAARLELTNTSGEPFTAASPLSPAALSIVVFDRLWNPVEASAVGKVHAGHDVLELGPRETRTFELPDLAYVGATAGLRFTLGPGRYFVLAVYHPPTDPLPERADFPLASSSNVAALEVRAG